jgi:hypothetical protein
VKILPVVAIDLAGWMGLGTNTNNLEQIDTSKLARYGTYFAVLLIHIRDPVIFYQ